MHQVRPIVLVRDWSDNESVTLLDFPENVSMIVVLAAIELNPGTRERFLIEFRQLVPLVRAETGCLEYFPAIDFPSEMPVQGPQRHDFVIVVEKWTNIEALQAHLVAPHMVAYRPKVKDFVKKVHLQIMEPAAE